MKKGFTLIELLVVIAIIGVIAGAVIGSLNFAKEVEGANYKVKFESMTYYVESYRKEDGGTCVLLPDLEKRFCGNWSAEKINEDI